MRELMKFSTRIAASGVSAVLIQGESGTGKDVIAKFLHFHSERRERPFVPINCAAIPDTLLESELFGFEKGAFTDARAQKRGVLELADGGTIFLDEIGDLQLHLQAKLLRVLEEQSFRRLGGMRDINVNVRVVTATNKTLIDAVRDKRFREDLFYRLNVIQIVIPPLRDHRDDILPLANHFIEHYNEKFRREIEGLDPEAADLLMGYPWPGNVRELRNAIERAMVLEEGPRITSRSLSLGGTAGPHGLAAQAAAAVPLQEMSLEDAERSMLVQALEKTGGNQTRAAKRLGISRDTLRYRMKKFDLK
jgi:transcriptional regulator with PAS, ATPase and Fis domain